MAVTGLDSGLSVRVSQPGPIPLNAQFSCAPGEVLSLVGPSGSGKSTLLRAIAGLYQPQHGNIALGGKSWFDSSTGVNLTPQQRPAGLVFQSYALFPHLDAASNVRAAMEHLPPADRNARARDLLAMVNLRGLEDRRPSELSGGQQQRVAVARALARDPQVLLLDEPFSAVDRATRQKLYIELAELRRMLRMPVILVTHDLDEAAMLADRMCILHHGETLQVGTPADVMSRPLSREIARLVDIKNVFEARVARHDHDRKLTYITWMGHVLESGYSPGFAADAPISWAIPVESVILHRRDRPSRGEHENPVGGTIVEFVVLGPNTTIGMRVDGGNDAILRMAVPTHVAHRNKLGPGEGISASLLSEAIHLMLWSASPPRHVAQTSHVI